MRKRMKKEKSCGAVVFMECGHELRVLLIRHVNGGHWAFPKGHVEQGETEEQTALREIFEETGLHVRLDTGFRRTVTYSPVPGITKDVVYFAAMADSGDVHRQMEEVTQIRFVPAEDAADIVTFENDKVICRAAAAYMTAHFKKEKTGMDMK